MQRTTTRLKNANRGLLKEIEEDKNLEAFLTRRRRRIKTSTMRNYEKSIIKFCLYHNKTPTELIEEANAEAFNVNEWDTKLFKRFRDFHDFLLSERTSYNEINHEFSHIRGFYKHRGIKSIPEYYIERPEYDPEPIPDIETLPDIEMVKKILDNSNKQYRAIFLLMFTSGMGGAETREITYLDFLNAITCKPIKRNGRNNVDYCIDLNIQKDYNNIELIERKIKEEKSVVPVWDLKRVKTSNPYRTFSSPESVETIMEHVKKRYYDKKMPGLNDYLFTNANGKKMTENALHTYVKRLRTDTEIKNSEVHFTPHRLRKLFLSIIGEEFGADSYIAKYIKGNRLSKDDMSYFYRNTAEHRLKYINILPKLSIYKTEVRLITNEDKELIIKQDLKIKELNKTLMHFIGKLERYDEIREDEFYTSLKAKRDHKDE